MNLRRCNVTDDVAFTLVLSFSFQIINATINSANIKFSGYKT